MLYLENRLKNLVSIMYYLDKHKILEQIKQKSTEYSNASSEQQVLVYIYSILVDLAELYDLNAELGSQVFFTPKEATNLFQEVIYQYISDLEILKPSILPSQICIKLRITSLPTIINQFHIHKISDLTKYSEYQGFIKLIGITTGISGHMKYTQSTKYICPDEQCDGHYSNQFIRMHVPGASEIQTIRSDFKCTHCGDLLEEIKSMRTLSDQMIAEVVPVNLKRYGKRETFKSKMSQAIPIYLRDELVDCVTIGKTYEFVGICRTDFSGEQIILTFEANNVLQIPQYEMIGALPDDLLPSTVSSLYKCYMISPWSFPLCMAYHFGEAIVPGNVMIKLRLLLLISLVLAPDESFLHLLAIGKELSLVQTLMSFALQFTCSFPVSITTPLYGKISNNRYPWVPYFIEGGSLFLSSDGISPLGDIGTLKKPTKENVKAALASGNILMEVPHKYAEAHTPPLSFPLRCHVWGFYDPSQVPLTKCNTSACNPFSGMSTGDLSKSFLDAFSIACFVDGNGFEDDMVFLNFHQDEDREENNFIPFETFQQYIDFALRVRTRLTPEAEELIHHYYSMSRIARVSGDGGANMPSTAISALKSLASGLAKLKLQKDVVESDAVWAIYLYEEQLTARYGISPLRVQSQPHLQQDHTKDFLIYENDLLLKQFHSRLLGFCSRTMGYQPEE